MIPKSTHKERMEENFNVFDFTLTAEEMSDIEALDGGESLFFSHYDPEIVQGLCQWYKKKYLNDNFYELMYLNERYISSFSV